MSGPEVPPGTAASERKRHRVYSNDVGEEPASELLMRISGELNANGESISESEAIGRDVRRSRQRACWAQLLRVWFWRGSTVMNHCQRSPPLQCLIAGPARSISLAPAVS